VAVLETIMVMLLFGIVVGLVTHFTTWNLAEQRASVRRQAAMEAAANVLETARVLSWTDLTPAWGSKQQLPDTFNEQLPDAKLTVQVQEEPGSPRLKRVSVELRWATKDTHPPAPFRLVGLFADRTAANAKEKP
jgi:hypothetical protein